MRIGELAAITGESARTIRFYESIGVLSEPPRSADGYRNYGVEAIDELRVVRTLQAAGFALNEIADIVALSSHPERCPGLLVDLVTTKQVEIDARLAACRRVKDQLQDIILRSSGPS